uniref:Uncharacterized protein n=1 Tax=Opuntia streptacantha TaxID=393608 RepID=A0A7C9ESQ7_OPUST
MLRRAGDGVHHDDEGQRRPGNSAAGSDRRAHPFSAVRFQQFQKLGQQLSGCERAQAVPSGGRDFPRRGYPKSCGDRRVDDGESELAESGPEIGHHGIADDDDRRREGHAKAFRVQVDGRLGRRLGGPG